MFLLPHSDEAGVSPDYGRVRQTAVAKEFLGGDDVQLTVAIYPTPCTRTPCPAVWRPVGFHPCKKRSLP